ncbi:hypothetical protein [Paraburkholderia sp. 2C]|jgi:hypothetical protein
MWCYPQRTSNGTRAAALAAAATLVAASPDLSAGTIRIASATYGDACDARAGNLTNDAASSCNNRDTCAYVVHAGAHTAPAACGNNFVVEWRCGDAQSHVANVNGDTDNGGTLLISCVMYGGAGH